MCCSLKAGVITIAILVIVFSTLQLIKNGHDLHAMNRHRHHHKRHHHEHHHEHHKHHHGRHHKHHHDHHHKHHHDDSDQDDMVIPPTAEPELHAMGYQEEKQEKKELMDANGDWAESIKSDHERIKDEIHQWFHEHEEIIRGVVIFSIVFNIIAIVTASLAFGAATNDVAKNQSRRHFLTPLIVVHVFEILFLLGCTIAGLYLMREYLRYAVLPIVLVLIAIGLAVFFLVVLMKYFTSLTAQEQFNYGQMDDIKKVPLA